MKTAPTCRILLLASMFSVLLLCSLGPVPAAEAPRAPEVTCPSCDDFSFCTVDSCDTTTGTCRHEPRNCDDQNPCTQDSCFSLSPNQGQCLHTNVASGTSCNDGDPCTQGDSCNNSSGLGFTCRGARLADGSTCDDGNSCTVTDACSAGACSGTPVSPGTPCDDQSLCTSGDTCVASSGPPICAGAAKDCGDGNPCTQDVCDRATGQCGNPAVNCNDGNSCTGDSCDAATGQCVRAFLTGSCNNGDFCTVNDFCSAGNCLAGQPRNCTDGYTCTRDSCSEGFGGCTYVRDDSLCPTLKDGCNDWHCDLLTLGTGCTNTYHRNAMYNCDNNLCTQNICDLNYHCVTLFTNCSDANPCTDDICDPATGICGPHVNNTASCNDGSACTTGDRCNNGVCQGVAACDDGNACTVDSCGTTACLHVAASCDDQDVCTIDSCEPASGCVHQSTSTPTTCGVGACQRTVDTCAGGLPCVPGTPTPEVCNGIDDDCDGLSDENRVQADCVLSPSTFNLSSQGSPVSLTCKLLDVCDPANPVAISGSSVSQVYVSRVDGADDPGDDVTLPDPSTLPCPDPVLGLVYERGISENLDARDVSNANVTFKFNLPSDGNCATLDGNRQDIAARLSAVPDNTSATICISGRTGGADFQSCVLVLVRNKGLR